MHSSNPGKVEFLLIGHEQQQRKYSAQFTLTLMGVATEPSKTARNLGVVFDKDFNFRKHIFQVCSSCVYHIRDLRRIRRHLKLDSAKTLACAPVWQVTKVGLLIATHSCMVLLEGILTGYSGSRIPWPELSVTSLHGY
jgi:hypothetical protein